MRIKSMFVVICGMCLSFLGKAQGIISDKTDANGRTIRTSSSEIYEHSGREGNIALFYLQQGSASFYLLSFDSQEDFDIHVGYKLLMKHSDGKITELTCVDNGESHIEYGSFGLTWWKPELYKTTKGVLYAASENQIKEIINNPVLKIRIEQALEYTDRNTGRREKSDISGAIKTAYEKIQANLTKETGLYDNF